ncbi:MAG: flagellar export chaperone FlgN [Thermogutta sp.]
MNQSSTLCETLIQLLAKKQRCLAEVHDLSQRQMACVTSGGVESLLEILAVKQRVLTELQALDRRLKEHGANDLDGHAIPEEQRERIATMVIQCRALLEKILSIESESVRILEERKNDVARQLAEFQDFVRARAAYQQPGEAINELDISS